MPFSSISGSNSSGTITLSSLAFLSLPRNEMGESTMRTADQVAKKSPMLARE